MQLKTTKFSIVITQKKSTMKLSEAIENYTEAKTDVYSQNTFNDYGRTFKRALMFFEDDPDIQDIDSQDIRNFLKTIPGGKKNKANAHIALSSLWTYLIKQEKLEKHIVRLVEVPKPEESPIYPYSEAEAQALLKSTADSKNETRDLAIVKTLLDTGIRASECMGLRLCDIRGDYLTVAGKGSLGKGPKIRDVPISASTMQTILDYITTDRKAAPRKAALFASSTTNSFMSRYSLGLLCRRLADRANVVDVFPHRFRHTFAVNYLLNGGDPYTLQDILGHTTMDMVKRYLHFVRHDLVKAHRKASPVSNWHM